MQIDHENWEIIRKEFKKSLFKAIATVNSDGSPHITPIGSLILQREFKGIYFEVFTRKMPANFDNNQRICVMSVNANLLFWLQGLYTGKFNTPPAVRIYGNAGVRRKATETEKELWDKKVKFFKNMKGYELLWKRADYVREIEFDSFEPVNAGVMTKGLWKENKPELSSII